MSKEELITRLEDWSVVMKELRVFLGDLSKEPDMEGMYKHWIGGFLMTAAEYLETNLDEMATKLRMK